MAKSTVTEIDQQIAELQARRREIEQEESKAQAVAQFNEANEKLELLRDTILRLDELGYLPEKIRTAVTNREGTLAPGLYIRRLRKVPEV